MKKKQKKQKQKTNKQKNEEEGLIFGLKHSVLSKPKESEMKATKEYVWGQIGNKIR